jgi:hypothetical protein
VISTVTKFSLWLKKTSDKKIYISLYRLIKCRNMKLFRSCFNNTSFVFVCLIMELFSLLTVPTKMLSLDRGEGKDNF